MQRARAIRRRSYARRNAFIIIAGVAIGLFAWWGFTMLRKTNTTLGEMLSPPFGGRRFVTVLVLGEDNTSKMRSTGRGLSDTIMVAAIDMEGKRVRGVSIPRDTRVEIPNHGYQKINAAHVFGGPEQTVESVKSVLGVNQIDYYVKTDIAGLKNIVDVVGGVGIDIEKNMNYTDRRGGLHINLKQGYRHLNGDQALQYVRFRHDKLGDITRMQRQQKFLRALARQMSSPGSWSKLPSIIDQIYSKGYVKTNLNLRDLMALAKLTKDIPPDKMEMETVPGVPERIGGISYFIADPVKTAEVANRLLSITEPVSASIEVLNGSGISGLAKSVADRLEASGYKVTSTGNAHSFNYSSSQIIVHNNQTDSKAVAELIGCNDVKMEASNASAKADITVIVGKDCKR